MKATVPPWGGCSQSDYGVQSSACALSKSSQYLLTWLHHGFYSRPQSPKTKVEVGGKRPPRRRNQYVISSGSNHLCLKKGTHWALGIVSAATVALSSYTKVSIHQGAWVSLSPRTLPPFFGRTDGFPPLQPVQASSRPWAMCLSNMTFLKTPHLLAPSSTIK